MKITGTASPGRVWAQDCDCREVLIDYVRGTVGHPYYVCRFYGQLTPLEQGEPTDG